MIFNAYVLNTIMPFDVENAVKFNSYYLRGYSMEKRDLNVEDLQPLIYTQSKNIARYAANDTLNKYDRGVCWQDENIDIKGMQLKTAYFPVWLYGYQDGNGILNNRLHYIAVNARTQETYGSIPFSLIKLLLILFAFMVSAIFIPFFLVLMPILVFPFLIITDLRYNDHVSRHLYERETKSNMYNVSRNDTYIKTEKGLYNPKMRNANNRAIRGYGGRDFTASIFWVIFKWILIISIVLVLAVFSIIGIALQFI